MKYPRGSRERDGSRASEEAAALKRSQQEERKTQRSGLCGGVEGDLYGIDSCRYVLLVNQAVSLVQKGAGAKSGGVAKQKSAGNVGKLSQVSLLHSAPLPALWQDVAAAPYLCCCRTWTKPFGNR